MPGDSSWPVWFMVVGAFLCGGFTAAAVTEAYYHRECHDRDCFPCLVAADWHASEWAATPDGRERSWHEERRAHWLKADRMSADCSGWREADKAAQEAGSA